MLISPLVADAESRFIDLQDVARTMQLRLLRLIVKSEEDFDTAFATIAARKSSALFVAAGHNEFAPRVIWQSIFR